VTILGRATREEVECVICPIRGCIQVKSTLCTHELNNVLHIYEIDIYSSNVRIYVSENIKYINQGLK